MKPGDSIDVWVVEKALGSGGMGSVYRCHNRSATRILAAVKVLDRSLRDHPEAERRFVREADILGQLDHRNIVKVRNVRHEHDPPYLEMEFVAGESLDDRMQRGALRYEEVVSLVRQCADALAYLHDRSVRHRDLKPANLLVTHDGTLKLVDFGLAVEVDRSRITQEGMAFGTVSYAPPEWITPDRMDPVKWDLYALGVIAWEALTGLVAFPVSGQGSARQQAMQVMMAKQSSAALDPGPEFPEPMRALVRDLTAPDARRRLGDARVVVERAAALPEHARPGGANVTLLPSPVDRPRPDSDARTTAPTVLSTTPPPADPRPALQGASARPAAARLALAAFGGVGLATVIGGAVLVVAGAAGAAWVWSGSRAVVLRVSGAEGAPVSVRLGEVEGRPASDGRITFRRVRAGDATFRWAAGEGCACAAEDCPSWCATGEATLGVPRGFGPFASDLVVTAPAPREVVLALPGVDPALPVLARLGGVEGRRTGGELRFVGVPPGVHPLTLTAGTCAPGAPACWPEGTCPPGCASGERPIEVPISGPAVPAELAVTVPPAVVEAPPPPPTPAPPRPRAGWATVRMLAAFVEANPSWGPGSARASAGGSGYLRGWTEAGPPPGTSPDAPATGVTGELARKVCQASGLDLADTRDLSDATDLELRREGEVVRLVERPEGAEPRLVPVGNRAVTGARWRCRR